jgi:hypothetical protein
MNPQSFSKQGGQAQVPNATAQQPQASVAAQAPSAAAGPAAAPSQPSMDPNAGASALSFTDDVRSENPHWNGCETNVNQPSGFNLDFGAIDSDNVLENFDFDSYLVDADALGAGGNSYDGSMAFGTSNANPTKDGQL